MPFQGIALYENCLMKQCFAKLLNVLTSGHNFQAAPLTDLGDAAYPDHEHFHTSRDR
jgi:hypothetical protein